MNCVLGLINFIMFLIMFGEKLNGIDFEDVIKNVFVCFDEDVLGIFLLCFLFNMMYVCFMLRM